MNEVSSHAPDALVDIDTCPLFEVCNEDDVQLRNLMNEFFVQNDDNSSENETVMNNILILCRMNSVWYVTHDYHYTLSLFLF